MPYIKQDERVDYEGPIQELMDALMANGSGQVGHLNYVLTTIAWRFYIRSLAGVGYSALSRVHGVLQDVAAEWYRRRMVPYEDRQMKDNGDVEVGPI